MQLSSFLPRVTLLAMCTVIPAQQGGGGQNMCECSIGTHYDAGDPLPPCVDHFGITISNQVPGQCRSGRVCTNPRECMATVTLVGVSRDDDPCDWEVYWYPEEPTEADLPWMLPCLPPIYCGSGDFMFDRNESPSCGGSSRFTFFADGVNVGRFFLLCNDCAANEDQ